MVIYRFYQDAYEFKHYLAKFGVPYKVFGDKSRRDRPFVNVIFALIRTIESYSIHKNPWKEVLLCLDRVGNKYADEMIEWLKIKDPNEKVYPKNHLYVESFQELLEFVESMKNLKAPISEKLNRIMKFAKGLPGGSSSVNEHIQPTLLKHAEESFLLSDIIGRYYDRFYPLYYPGTRNPPYPNKYLTLSNVHRIKGGEFHTVFYLGATDKNYIKYQLLEKTKTRESELHVSNVTATRSRRRLFLLFPINLKEWERNQEASNPWQFFRKVDNELYNVVKKKCS
jgi:superfamily I DNA/RNA helicase